jgi:hypothetical protein
MEPNMGIGDECEENQAVPEAEPDIGKLVSEVTSTKRLYLVAKKYLVPKGLAENVRPSDEWLKKLACD